MQTIQKIEAAFNAANNAYIKRNPDAKSAKEGKIQADIAAGLKTFATMRPENLALLEKLGIDWEKTGKGLGQCTNVKIARRLPQLLLFVVSGNGAYLQGSAKTALLGFCALLIGAKNKNGLEFVVTGKGDENTSDSVSIQRARAVQRAFGKVQAGSSSTQKSVSFSSGGLLDILGACSAWGKGDKMPAIVPCKFSQALEALITGASEGTIERWAQESDKKA